MTQVDESVSHQNTTHFLLVEDDENHAYLIQRHLKRCPVKITISHVTDGVMAAEYVRKQGNFVDVERPDVILLDLNLPRMGGHEFLEMIKSDDSLYDIPVVILSTSRNDRDVSEAYKHHANSYMVKPVDFEEFGEMVNQLGTYWGRWNQKPPSAFTT